MSKTRMFHTPRPQAATAGPAVRAIQRSVVGVVLREILTPEDGLAPLHLPAAPEPIAPRQMAATESPDATTRAALARRYTECLQLYRELARAQRPEVSDDDLGAAMAFFVAVNLQVLHDTEVGTGVLPILERQLRGAAARASGWRVAPLAERQAFFERLAIGAISVSGLQARAVAQGGVALADVRRTSQQYLHRLLGLNAEWLTLAPEGLVARQDPVAAHAA